jgi:hypothetical protein
MRWWWRWLVVVIVQVVTFDVDPPRRCVMFIAHPKREFLSKHNSVPLLAEEIINNVAIGIRVIDESSAQNTQFEIARPRAVNHVHHFQQFNL